MLPFYLDFSLYVYVVAYVKYKGKYIILYISYICHTKSHIITYRHLYIIYRMCSVVRVFSVVFDSLLPQAL